VLFYDGQEVGRDRILRTQPLIFSAEESTDIGYESGPLVIPDYPAHNGHITGQIHWVQLDTGQDSCNHLIKPEDSLLGHDATVAAAEHVERGLPQEFSVNKPLED
jgi:hypothetical protein